MIAAHLDDTGAPCGRHPAPAADEVLTLALIATRLQGFHHDLASKLQGLMMAVDEITELTAAPGADPGLQEVVGAAAEALKEILELLNANRALTKPAVPAVLPLGDLLARAAARAHVLLAPPVSTEPVEVPAPLVTQALALALDVAGGPGRHRVLESAVTTTEGHVELVVRVLPGAPPDQAGRSLGLAAALLAREGGALCCAADGARLQIRLPRPR